MSFNYIDPRNLFGFAATAPAAQDQSPNNSTQPAEEKAVETLKPWPPAPTVTSEEEEHDNLIPPSLADNLQAAALTGEAERSRVPPSPQASRGISSLMGSNTDARFPTEKAKHEDAEEAEAEAQASTDDAWESMSTSSSSTISSADLDETWDEEELDARQRREERLRKRAKEEERQKEERSVLNWRLMRLEGAVQELTTCSAAHNDSMQRQATSIVQAHKGVADVRGELYKRQEEYDEVARGKMETLAQKARDHMDNVMSGSEERLESSFEYMLDQMCIELECQGDTRITEVKDLIEKETAASDVKIAELRKDVERMEEEQRKLFDEQRAELGNAGKTVSTLREKLDSVHRASAETAKRTTHLQGLLGEVADGLRADVAMLKEKLTSADRRILGQHDYILHFRALVQGDRAKNVEAQKANDAKFQKQEQELDEVRRSLAAEARAHKAHRAEQANKENSRNLPGAATLFREAAARQEGDKKYLETQMNIQMGVLKESLEEIRKMIPASAATQQRRNLATKAEMDGQIQALTKSLEEATGRIQRLEAEKETMKDLQTPEISPHLNEVATRLRSGFDRFADEVQAVKNHVNHVWDFVTAQHEQNMARLQGDLEGKVNKLRDEIAKLTG